jgi:flagellar protein FlbD
LEEMSKGMIQLTRLNNQTLILNADLVKFVEQAPDTVITLVNGEKFIVRESVDEVVQRILRFRCSIMQGVAANWNSAPSFLALQKDVQKATPPEK